MRDSSNPIHSTPPPVATASAEGVQPAASAVRRFVDRALWLRRSLSIVLHAALVVLSNFVAFWLRFDGQVPVDYAAIQLQTLPWLVGLRLLTLWRFRLFEGLWKYTSLWDLRNIIAAVIGSTAGVAVVTTIVTQDTGYPRSIYIIDAIVLIGLMSAARLARRIHREFMRSTRGRRVLVYGAGDAGEMIVREMRHNDAFDAEPIGFIDDDESKVGQRIHGVPVLGTRDDIEKIITRHQTDEVLIAIPGAGRDTLRQIVRALESHRVRITTLPRISDLIGQRVALDQIRQLKVEDLLARDPVQLDDAPVRRFLARKRVLVTGAGGSIGSELCRQIVDAGPSAVFLLDRYENSLFQINHELAERPDAPTIISVIADVTDAKRMDQVLGELKPDVIFHAAAHKHVPLMEDNPCEAVKNNVRGTRIVAETALRYGVERFVLISTDKAVNPTSVMGATKRVAELIVTRLAEHAAVRFATVRFGNVLASNGSVVPRFLGQIANGGPVTVTHPDMRRYFMLIPEAVQLVLHAASLEGDAPVYVLDMGEQVKVTEMARQLIRLSGLVPDKDIAIEYTGMRPGEKLFEELVGLGEIAEPSSMPKVHRVTWNGGAHPGGLRFADAIARLEAFALEGDADETLRALCTVVPNFTPSRRVAVSTV